MFAADDVPDRDAVNHLTEWACGEVFAVDPGLNEPGAALSRGGKIIAAERVKVDKAWAKLPIGERAARVAEQIVRWGMAHNMEPRALVYEKPQVYSESRGKSKADPNDLVDIALVAANVSGMLRLAVAQRGVCLQILSPKPAEWIGRLPKHKTGDPWETPRGIRIRSRLDMDMVPEFRATGPEFASIIPSHDAVDAVGLLLWAMGRLEQRRVFPGAVAE